MEGKMNAVELRGKIRSFMIDRTLTIAGAAADAKATGDAIIGVAVGDGVIEAKVKSATEAEFAELRAEVAADFEAFESEVEADLAKVYALTKEQIEAVCK